MRDNNDVAFRATLQVCVRGFRNSDESSQAGVRALPTFKISRNLSQRIATSRTVSLIAEDEGRVGEDLMVACR